MITSTSTDDGFPIRCEICGTSSIVNVSRPPGDSVCPACGTFLWVAALAEVARLNQFVPDLTLSHLDSTNRDDSIAELAQAIADRQNWTTAQHASFVHAVLKREELGSTGIGRGFAVPHAAVDWIDCCCTVMGCAPNGIAFNALDEKPVHTIILIASPKSCPADHLRLLERISRSIRWVGNTAA
jgi:PTS system fructose-specific IIA component/PTS system nitrogen regulatory IIA component